MRAITAALVLFFLTGCQQLFVKTPSRIKAYTSDIPTPYRILGQVEGQYANPYFERRVAKVNNYEINYKKHRDMDFHKTGTTTTSAPIQQHPNQDMAKLRLIDMAYYKYRDILGAVIRVQFSSYLEYKDPYDRSQEAYKRVVTKATGLAICFIDKYGQCVVQNDANPASLTANPAQTPTRQTPSPKKIKKK